MDLTYYLMLLKIMALNMNHLIIILQLLIKQLVRLRQKIQEEHI